MVVSAFLAAVPLLVVLGFTVDPFRRPVDVQGEGEIWWWVLIGALVLFVAAALAVRLSAQDPQKYLRFPDPVGQAHRSVIGSIVLTYLFLEGMVVCGVIAGWLFDRPEYGIAFSVPALLMMAAWFPKRKNILLILQRTKQMAEIQFRQTQREQAGGETSTPA
jgi:MFS family permease